MRQLTYIIFVSCLLCNHLLGELIEIHVQQSFKHKLRAISSDNLCFFEESCSICGWTRPNERYRVTRTRNYCCLSSNTIFFPELRQSNVNYRINFQIKLAHETNLFYFHVKVKSKARTSQARFNNSTLSEPCPKRPPHHRIRESDLILCNLFSVTHKKWLILLWRLTSLNSKVTKSLIGGKIQLLQLLFACC